MNKEVISDREGISLIILFIIGTNSIMAAGLSAQKDIWLAIFIGLIMALPIMLIFARLHSIFLNKDFFQVIEMCFGKFLGKAVIAVLTVYFFGEIPVVTRNFAQFPVTVSLNNTPQIIITTIFMISCAWVVKEGIQVIGKWGKLFLIVFIIIPIITTILMLNIFDIDNLLPVLNYGIKPVLKGAYEVLMFPFSQIVVFMMVFSGFNKQKSPYKIYVIGVLIGGILLWGLSLTTVLVLGVNSASRLYYPTYDIWLRISIGGFQRMEIIQGAMLTIGAFIKVSIFLLATCKGVSKIFEIDDYRVIVTPIALLTIILARFQFHSVMHYFEWNDEVWYYYAFPFQIILPIIIWVAAEFKKKRIIGIE